MSGPTRIMGSLYTADWEPDRVGEREGVRKRERRIEKGMKRHYYLPQNQLVRKTFERKRKREREKGVCTFLIVCVQACVRVYMHVCVLCVHTCVCVC